MAVTDAAFPAKKTEIKVVNNVTNNGTNLSEVCSCIDIDGVVSVMITVLVLFPELHQMEHLVGTPFGNVRRQAVGDMFLNG